jgi:hypothetical protein
VSENDERAQRRSARRLLDSRAEVHLGANTVEATVCDVSQHGMGLQIPEGATVQPGDTIWIVSHDVAEYAITAIVRRVYEPTRIGVEFEEILAGPALEKIGSLPLSD